MSTELPRSCRRLRAELPRCIVICPDANLRTRISSLLQDEGFAVLALSDDRTAPRWASLDDDECDVDDTEGVADRPRVSVVHATRDASGAVRLTWKGRVGFDVLENIRVGTCRDAA